MFRSKLIALILVLFAPLAVAQSKATKSTGKTPSKTARVRAKKPIITNQLQVGAAIWQENFKLSNVGGSSLMVGQSTGLTGAYAWTMPFRGKWRQHHAAELGLGFLRGRGNNDLVPDGFRNQLWYRLGAVPGLMYRTSAFAELGVTAPVYFRQVQWKTNGSVNVESESDFSVGVSGVYLARVSRDASVHLSLGHQYFWKSTVWSIAWQYELR